jgi:hypothetical protein
MNKVILKRPRPLQKGASGVVKRTDRDEPIWIAGRYPVFPAAFVEEAVFSPSYVFSTFLKN